MATLRSRLNQTQSATALMPQRDYDEDDEPFQPRQEQTKAPNNREQSRIDAYLKR